MAGRRRASFAGYTLLGAFTSARSVSPLRLLLDDDPVEGWRRRLLDHFGGPARNARTAAPAAA